MTGTAGYPVHWWPAPLDGLSGPLVIGVDGAAGRRELALPHAGKGSQRALERSAARERIRLALRAALGELTGVPPAAIMIQSPPGRAPAVSFPGSGHGALPGIAITHDEPLSLAAINLHGPVGIDLMRVAGIDDWRAVAHDYLGPRVAALLEAAAPTRRARAFAQAWTEHEARLKCHGLPLVEWSAQLAARLGRCHCRPLAVPDGLAGAIAWLD